MWLSDAYIKKLKRAGWRVEHNSSSWARNGDHYFVYEGEDRTPFVIFVQMDDGMYGVEFEVDCPHLHHDTIKLFAQCISNLNDNMKV